MSYEIKGHRLSGDVNIRFAKDLSTMDRALYAAYRRGSKDAAAILVRNAKRIALRKGVNFLDLKLGFLLGEALDKAEKGTEQ
jgi:hypothetical protein